MSSSLLGRNVLAGIAVAALAVLALVSGCKCDGEPNDRPGSLTKVVLAQNPVPHSALPIIAKKKGYFKEEGLDVTVQEFTTGKLCFDAMLGGGADFSTVAETPIMYAGFSKQPVYVIATIESSPLSVKVLARKDKGVSKPGDLRGKAVGTFKGGSAVRGGAKSWRGAEQKRSAHASVYPGPSGASRFNSPTSPVVCVSSAAGCPAGGSSRRWPPRCAPDASAGPASRPSAAPSRRPPPTARTAGSS